jgi:hypothetical protein
MSFPMLDSITIKVLALMLRLVPLSQQGAHPPDYTAIAADIALVASMEGDGEHDALTLARIAAYESSYTDRVDRCQQAGDGGRAWGLWQVHSRVACSSRLVAATIALRMIHQSRRACGDLSLYTSGRCGVGERAAKLRDGK